MFASTAVTDFGLVFVRIAAMAAILPNPARSFPLRMRIGLALAITLLVAPLVMASAQAPGRAESWIEAAIEQGFWGAFLGGTMRFWLSSCVVAGAWISQVAGWGASEVAMDGQDQAPALSQFHGWLGGLTFLAIDGPNMVIRALLDSFSAVPVTGVTWQSAPLMDIVATALNQSLWLSLRMGSPVLTSIVASSLAVAAIQRAIPHVNLVRFQIAGNWLVLLVALSLTLGLNADRWRNDVAGLLRGVPQAWSSLGTVEDDRVSGGTNEERPRN
jgi:flagellar biosynthesis protein FliR